MFVNLVNCSLSKSAKIHKNQNSEPQNVLKMVDFALHNVEKSSKPRSLFLRKNHYFFRQTNVFTKEVTSYLYVKS